MKSWRICTTERFEPSADASVRSVLLAALSLTSAAFADELSKKSVPDSQRSKAKAGRVESHALNVQRGLAGLVEGQLEIIAVQQIDAVERRILRRRRDLRDDVVVLLHQARTNVLGSRIGERFAGGAPGGGDKRKCGGAAERNGIRSCRRAER